MKRSIQQWNNWIQVGDDALKTEQLQEAIASYQKAQQMAEQLIDNTVVDFRGETIMLRMYSYACSCVMQAYWQAGNPAESRQCLEQASQKLQQVLKNAAFPIPVRGKAIREYDFLFGVVIDFCQATNQPEQAGVLIGQTLADLSRYITTVKPIGQIARLN